MHNLKEKIMGIIELIKSNKQLKRFIVSLVVIIAVIFCFLSSCSPSSSSSSSSSYMNKFAENLVEEIADGNLSNVQKLLNDYNSFDIKNIVKRIRIETKLYGGIYSAEASKQIKYSGNNEVDAKEARVKIRVLFKKKGLYASHCAELGEVIFLKNEAGEWYPNWISFYDGRPDDLSQSSVDEGFLDSSSQ